MTAREFVDAVAAVAGDAAVGRARRLLAEADVARAQPSEWPVVALVGGTGSGKSSVLNALAGTPIAEVGIARPTTEEPIAWLPDAAAPGLDGLLDRFGVLDRVRDPSAPDITVIDLPDTDSVREGHALVAEWVLPRADVVVWVADPVKYHDARTAEMLLRHRGPGLPGVVVALNKADILRPDERVAVREDLVRFAGSMGWEGSVVTVAADPAGGSPTGIDVLWDAVRSAVGAHDPITALERSALDAAHAAAPVGVERVVSWEDVRAELVERMLAGLAPEQVPPSLTRAARAASAIGGAGPFGRVLHALRHGRAAEMASIARERHRRLVGAWEGSPEVADIVVAVEARFAEAAPYAASGTWDRAAVEGAASSLARDVAVTASSGLEIGRQRWWGLGSTIAWLSALVVVAAVAASVAQPGRAGWWASAALLACAVGVALAGAALASGRAVADRTWANFRTAVADEAARAADVHLAPLYRSVAGPARTLAAMQRDPSVQRAGDPMLRSA